MFLSYLLLLAILTRLLFALEPRNSSTNFKRLLLKAATIGNFEYFEYNPNLQRKLDDFKLFSTEDLQKNWIPHTANRDASLTSEIVQNDLIINFLKPDFSTPFAVLASRKNLPDDIFNTNQLWHINVHFKVSGGTAVGLVFADKQSADTIFEFVKDGAFETMKDNVPAIDLLGLTYSADFFTQTSTNKVDEHYKCDWLDDGHSEKDVYISMQKISENFVILKGEIWAIDDQTDAGQPSEDQETLRRQCLYEGLHDFGGIFNNQTEEQPHLFITAFDQSVEKSGVVDVIHFQFSYMTPTHPNFPPNLPIFADQKGQGPIEVSKCNSSNDKNCFLDCSTSTGPTFPFWFKERRDNGSSQLYKLENVTGKYHVPIGNLRNVEVGDRFICYVTNAFGAVQRTFAITEEIIGNNWIVPYRTSIEPTTTTLKPWHGVVFFLGGAITVALIVVVILGGFYLYRRERKVDYITKETSGSSTELSRSCTACSYSPVQNTAAAAEVIAELEQRLCTKIQEAVEAE